MSAFEDRAVTKVAVWYATEWKSWVIQQLDAEGNQVGELDYMHSKSYAKKVAKELATKLKICLVTFTKNWEMTIEYFV